MTTTPSCASNDEEACYRALCAARLTRSSRCPSSPPLTRPVDADEKQPGADDSTIALTQLRYVLCCLARQDQQKGKGRAADAHATGHAEGDDEKAVDRAAALIDVPRHDCASLTAALSSTAHKKRGGVPLMVQVMANTHWLSSLEALAASPSQDTVNGASEQQHPSKVTSALQFEPVPFPRRLCPSEPLSTRASRYAQQVLRTCPDHIHADRDGPCTLATATTIPGFTAFTSLVTPSRPPPPSRLLTTARAEVCDGATGSTSSSPTALAAPQTFTPPAPAAGAAAEGERNDVGASEARTPLPPDRATSLPNVTSSVVVVGGGGSHAADASTAGSSEVGLVSAAARLLESTTSRLFSPSSRRNVGPAGAVVVTREKEDGAAERCVYAHRQQREARRLARGARLMRAWEARRVEALRQATTHNDASGGWSLASAEGDLDWYRYSFGITARDLTAPEMDTARPDSDAHADAAHLSQSQSGSSVCSRDIDDDDGSDENGERPSDDACEPIVLSASLRASFEPGVVDECEDDLSFSFFDRAREGGSPAHSRADMSSSNSFASFGDCDVDHNNNNDDINDKDENQEEEYSKVVDAVEQTHADVVPTTPADMADDAQTKPPRGRDGGQGSDGSLTVSNSFALTTPTHRHERTLSETVSTDGRGGVWGWSTRGAHIAYLFTPVPRVTSIPDTTEPSTANTAKTARTEMCATCVLYVPSGEGYLIGTASGVLWYAPSRDGTAPLQVTALGTVHHGAASAEGTSSALPQAQQRMEPLAGHSDAITSLNFNDDGSLFCSGSLDGSVILWSTARRDKIRRMQVAAVTTTAADSGRGASRHGGSKPAAAYTAPLTTEEEHAEIEAVLGRHTAARSGGETGKAASSTTAATASLSAATSSMTAATAVAALPKHLYDARAAPSQASFVPLNNNFLLVLTQLPEGALRLFNCSTGLAVAHVAVTPAPLQRSVSSGVAPKTRKGSQSSRATRVGHNNNNSTSTSGGGAFGFFSALFAAGPVTGSGGAGHSLPSRAPRDRDTRSTGTTAASSSSASSTTTRKGAAVAVGATTAMAVTALAAPFFFTGDASGHVHVWTLRPGPLSALTTLRTDTPHSRSRHGQARHGSPSLSHSPVRGGSTAPSLLAMQPRQLPELHHVCSLALPLNNNNNNSNATTARAGAEAVGRLEVSAMNAVQANAWVAAADSSTPSAPRPESVVHGNHEKEKSAVGADTTTSPTTATTAAPTSTGITTTTTAAVSTPPPPPPSTPVLGDHGAVQRLFQQLSSLTTTAATGGGGTGSAGHNITESPKIAVDSLIPVMLVASQAADVCHVLAVTQHTPSLSGHESTSSTTVDAQKRGGKRRSSTHRAAPTTTATTTGSSEKRESSVAPVEFALVVLHTVRGVCRMRHVMPWCAPLSVRYGRGGGAIFCTDNVARPIVTCACDEGFIHLLSVPLAKRQTRRAARDKLVSPSAETSSMIVTLASLAVPCGGVCSDLCWSPDNRFLIAVTNDGLVYEWERLYLWRGDAQDGGYGNPTSPRPGPPASAPTATTTSAVFGAAASRLANADTLLPAGSGGGGVTGIPAALGGLAHADDGDDNGSVTRVSGGSCAWAVEEEEGQWRQRVYEARQAQRMAWLRTHPDAQSSSNSDEASLCTSRFGSHSESPESSL